MQLTVKQLKEKIKHNEAILATDLQKWDKRTLPSMQGLQNRAKDELEVLKFDLRNTLVRNAVVIVTDNAVNADVVAALIEKSESDKLDFFTLENKLINFIYQSVNVDKGYRVNNEFSVRLNTALTSIAYEMGALAMTPVDIPATRYGTYKDRNAIVKLLHELLTKTYETELKEKYLQLSLGAIAGQHINDEKDYISIVITNVPETFLNVVDGTSNFIIKVSPNAELQNIVLFTEGETDTELTAYIVEAIKNQKLKGV